MFLDDAPLYNHDPFFRGKGLSDENIARLMELAGVHACNDRQREKLIKYYNEHREEYLKEVKKQQEEVKKQQTDLRRADRKLAKLQSANRNPEAIIGIKVIDLLRFAAEFEPAVQEVRRRLGIEVPAVLKRLRHEVGVESCWGFYPARPSRLFGEATNLEDILRIEQDTGQPMPLAERATFSRFAKDNPDKAYDMVRAWERTTFPTLETELNKLGKKFRLPPFIRNIISCYILYGDDAQSELALFDNPGIGIHEIGTNWRRILQYSKRKLTARRKDITLLRQFIMWELLADGEPKKEVIAILRRSGFHIRLMDLDNELKRFRKKVLMK